MSVLYSVLGILANTKDSFRFPPKLLNVFYVFAFGEEFLLFYTKNKDPNGIENHYYDLILVPIAVCLFSTILELESTESIFPKLGRGESAVVFAVSIVYLIAGIAVVYTAPVRHGCLEFETPAGYEFPFDTGWGCPWFRSELKQNFQAKNIPAMIAGYAQHDMFAEALKPFKEMQEQGIGSDNIGLASVLSACAGIQALNQGRQIHSQSIVSGYSSDASVGNALVCLYARCGCILEEHLVFEKMYARDDVTWNGLDYGWVDGNPFMDGLMRFWVDYEMLVSIFSCDIGGMFAIATGIDDIHKEYWIGFHTLCDCWDDIEEVRLRNRLSWEQDYEVSGLESDDAMPKQELQGLEGNNTWRNTCEGEMMAALYLQILLSSWRCSLLPILQLEGGCWNAGKTDRFSCMKSGLDMVKKNEEEAGSQF